MFKKGRIISHRGIHDNIKIFENGEKNQRVAYVNKQDRHWGIDK